MKKILLTILAFTAVVSPSALSQTISSVLSEIERNSPYLSAARSASDAEKLEAKSESRLENPEAGFNYLWGQDGIGGRHDFNISQKFDYATLSGAKSRLVKNVGLRSDYEYAIRRQEILLQAKELCIDLIYYDSLLKELESHKVDAERLVRSYNRKMELGEATVLETNKAKLHLSSVNGDIAKAKVARGQALQSLASINGGVTPEVSGLTYDGADILPEDFEKWYEEAVASNPVLNYASADADVKNGQLKIARNASVPELSVGYMDELARSDKYRGLTLGVSVPLWKNSAKIRSEKAEAEAAQENLRATETLLHASLLSEYNSAKSLCQLVQDYRSSLRETDNRTYLGEAQAKGEISILDYLVEVDMYYDALAETLSAEREYHKALARLHASEL